MLPFGPGIERKERCGPFFYHNFVFFDFAVIFLFDPDLPKLPY
jgi:hypothetical protein